MQIALQPAPYCAKSQCAHVQRTCRDMRHHKFSEACSRMPEVPAAMLLALRLAPGICKTGTGEADHYNEALRGLRGRMSGVCLKRRSEKEKARTARAGPGQRAAEFWCAEPDSNRHGVATVRT